MSKDKTLTEKAAPWRDMLLVCGKCSRKLKGGFGRKAKHRLRSELKDALRGRRTGTTVIEVDCLGLCPKRAVTMLRASQPDRFLIVPAGMDARDVLGLQAAGDSVMESTRSG